MHIESSIFPDAGSIVIDVNQAPVSLQGSKQRRKAISEAVRNALGNPSFLLTGDVKITIRWMLHEQTRYETDQAPDVDNIIKPILDGLCGPSALLIDDCQVQAVTCYWVDWTQYEQAFSLIIEYLPDEKKKKDGLAFIHIKDNLCMPLCTNLPVDFLASILESFHKMFQAREEELQLSGDYYFAKQMMSIQRVFHKSKLTAFPVFELNDFCSQYGISLYTGC